MGKVIFFKRIAQDRDPGWRMWVGIALLLAIVAGAGMVMFLIGYLLVEILGWVVLPSIQGTAEYSIIRFFLGSFIFGVIGAMFVTWTEIQNSPEN